MSSWIGHAVDADLAARRLVEAEQQLHDGALAGAGGADDGVGLAGGDLEVEPVEDVAAGGVGEGHVVEAHRAAHGRRAGRASPGWMLGSTVSSPKIRRHEAIARW